MIYLWLLAIPPWVFIWTAACVWFFKTAERTGFDESWAFMPVWMAFGMTVIGSAVVVPVVFIATKIFDS